MWETKWSFNGKLYQERSYQKLSKSDNWFSSYSRKCRGCFFGTQCTSLLHNLLEMHQLSTDNEHLLIIDRFVDSQYGLIINLIVGNWPKTDQLSGTDNHVINN